MDPIQQAINFFYSVWGVVSNQWGVAVVKRWQTLQATANAVRSL